LSPVLVLVTLDEYLKVRGDFRHLHIAAPTDFVGNIFRYIARPALSYIETDDAHRVGILAVEQIADVVSRSVASTSVSHHARPCRPEALGGRFKVMKSAFIGSTSRLKIFSE
jgi:hypothetical protein